MISALKNRDAVLLSPQTVTDGATVTANFDCADGDWATLRLNFAIEETTHAANSTISVLESDDTVVSNFATIVANRSEDLTAAHEVRYEVDLRNRKRYLRLSVTAGSETGGNIIVGAVGTLSRLDDSPKSTSDMQMIATSGANSTVDAVVVV